MVEAEIAIFQYFNLTIAWFFVMSRRKNDFLRWFFANLPGATGSATGPMPERAGSRVPEPRFFLKKAETRFE